MAQSEEDVAAKGQGVAGGETEENDLYGKDAGGKIARPPEDALEVVFLASGARDGQAKFEVDAQPRES